MKRIITVWVIFVVCAIAGLGLAYYLQNRSVSGNEPSGSPAPAANVSQPQPKESESIVLLATGDMIAHDSINASAKKPDGTYDYAALMSDMQPYFDIGDVNFCNQATPAGGEAFNITGYPIFNAPIAFSRGIENIGCNVVNLGTNHTNDKGQPLVDATVAAWDERKNVFAVAGANRSIEEQAKPRIFETKGMKFAFVAYSDYTNIALPNEYGVNRYSSELAKSQIAEAKKSADFVIASIRWGTEYSPEINARQDQIAQELADMGADVLLGHGSHVLQPVKKLTAADNRDVYVWYSLGNFLNSQLETEARIGGFAKMNINPKTKKITNIGFMPVYQHYEWTAAEKASNNLLARKNFRMLPLDAAEDLLNKSLLETTVQAQTDRVNAILNKYTELPLISSDNF